MNPMYAPSDADRLPVPRSYRTIPRYLGYRDADRQRAFAGYFRPTALPMQTGVAEQFDVGALPALHGFELSEAADILSRPGYLAVENGWLRTGRGTLMVAVLTDMPGVSAEMWDWWFGWHSVDSARYKLWHPEAHQFSAIADDRSHDRSLTDRQRYQNNVSFVDEFVGKALSRLAIRFIDPARVGFEDSPGATVICAAVGLSAFPVIGGWIVHQVRPTVHGVEMRSRFLLGHPQIIDIPPRASRYRHAGAALTSGIGRGLLHPLVGAVTRTHATASFARSLGRHCATEMNHLASFLPDLFADFRDLP